MRKIILSVALSGICILSIAQSKQKLTKTPPAKKTVVNAVKKQVDAAKSKDVSENKMADLPAPASNEKSTLKENTAQDLGVESSPVNQESEMTAAIKELLVNAANKTVVKLGSVDGFYKDSLLKIQMPEEAKKAAGMLKKIGMGKLVDDAILSMNRSAEAAAVASLEEITGAIKNMTVDEALEVIKNKDTSATKLLKRKTNVGLSARIKPIVESSLNKNNATKYWSDVFSAYNKISPSKVNPNLTEYVHKKVMDAIFQCIAEREMQIRKSPESVSQTVKKYFGNLL